MDPKKIGIIGAEGKLGRWFVDFFVRNGCQVIGSDLGTLISNREVVECSEVVVIAVPLALTVGVIKEVLPYSNGDQLFIDVASVKREVIREIFKGEAEVLSIHPLFAPKPGKTWKGETVAVFDDGCPLWGDWAKRFLEKTEATIVRIDALEHDRMMLVEQNLPHAAAFALAWTIMRLRSDPKKLVDLSTRFSKHDLWQIARMLKQGPGVYADIQFTDAARSVEMIECFIGALSSLRQMIAEKDKASFIGTFNGLKAYFGDEFIERAESPFPD